MDLKNGVMPLRKLIDVLICPTIDRVDS